MPASWGAPPITSITLTVTDPAGTDVTSTVLPGAASASGNIITLPQLKGLTAGKLYRVVVHFTIGGSEEEGIVLVQGEK